MARGLLALARGAAMETFETLIGELESLVNRRATGTFFVSTSEQHSARFSIERGEIISVAYRVTRGLRALPMLKAIRFGTGHFQVGFILAGPAGEELPPTPELLQQLRE